MRRFASRPSAVMLGAMGSALARPSVCSRFGSPRVLRHDRAGGGGTGRGKLEVRWEPHRADRLVVGVTDHLHGTRFRLQCGTNAAQQWRRLFRERGAA